ncbi:hypothetical protein [Mycolicibacterium hodleri]|uniref:Uncharacterized protein n=1 Tax=Mycolicibacterium hodleri TaxID=49897 RepID=A0A502EI47_9MYCO|nr:hypothetical protein [Mycolicibacterium hodleri]TPG36814.1 hypothetical protein EAH80_02540 [Mycolicibacterium hodleri]
MFTYFQTVLTSVGDASTTLLQLPNDLAGLLGVGAVAGTAPIATNGALAGVSSVRMSPLAPTTEPGWSALPEFLVLPAVEGGAAATPLPVPATSLDITTTGVASGASDNAPAPSAREGDGKSDVLSTVKHVIGAVVATVSLTALAAVALPGLLGLLSTCAAGIRLGYRQAKAGTQLPDTVVSRFVGSGPIGVVRSSGQVQLRLRAPRIARTSSRLDAPERALHVVRSDSSAAHLLDQAV